MHVRTHLYVYVHALLSNTLTNGLQEDGLNPHLSTLFPGVWQLLFAENGAIRGIADRSGREKLLLEVCE